MATSKSKVHGFFGGKDKPVSWQRRGRELRDVPFHDQPPGSKLNKEAIKTLHGDKRKPRYNMVSGKKVNQQSR